MLTHYFSCLCGPGLDSIKSVLGHITPNFYFLHLVGSVGHIVHSDAFGSQNTDTLFFMPKWAQCGFHKKHVGTRYAKLVFLHSMGSTCHVMHSLCPGRENLVHYFSCSCGLGTDSIKSVLGHVTPNFCFFCTLWDLRDIVHSGVFGSQNIDALFFMLRWA
jgi:hypothetical protein